MTIWIVIFTFGIMTCSLFVAFIKHLESDAKVLKELNDINDYQKELFNLLEERVSELEGKK